MRRTSADVVPHSRWCREYRRPFTVCFSCKSPPPPATLSLWHFLACDDTLIVQVTLVSSALAWLLVGSSIEEFSTLQRAWQSVTRISLGESENFYPQILEAQPTLGPVVVVLYQVLGIVLLLNVVIAILLEVRWSFCLCFGSWGR